MCGRVARIRILFRACKLQQPRPAAGANAFGKIAALLELERAAGNAASSAQRQISLHSSGGADEMSGAHDVAAGASRPIRGLQIRSRVPLRRGTRGNGSDEARISGGTSVMLEKLILQTVALVACNA